MKREELVRYRISSLLSTEANYSFPDFLRALRRVQGLSRRQVSHELGLRSDRLFYLEMGKFRRGVPSDELTLLAEYFGVPADLLESKAHAFSQHGMAERIGA